MNQNLVNTKLQMQLDSTQVVQAQLECITIACLHNLEPHMTEQCVKRNFVLLFFVICERKFVLDSLAELMIGKGDDTMYVPRVLWNVKRFVSYWRNLSVLELWKKYTWGL